MEREENSNTLTKKNENDKASAEESRLKAMERLGQTRKRNAHTSCYGVTKPKRRGSTTEAVQILKEKFKNKKEIRKEEIGLKKKEQENKAAQHQMLKDLQRQNQQQYQDVLRIMAEQQHRQEQQPQNFHMVFLQQQQQHSKILMGLLKNVLPKTSREKGEKAVKKRKLIRRLAHLIPLRSCCGYHFVKCSVLRGFFVTVSVGLVS